MPFKHESSTIIVHSFVFEGHLVLGQINLF